MQPQAISSSPRAHSILLTCRCTTSVRESRKPLRDNNHGQTGRHPCQEFWTLLAHGVDVTVIALWLGHEQPATTAQIYLHADMTQKERAIARVAPPGTTAGRYRPPDTLLAFLDGL